ncbi:acetyl-CoA acetyltransferase [Hyaloraphidium curvatum]|nr:acetyl-CoA acetyltransferase [Hyaloraphidium curvatum]
MSRAVYVVGAARTAVGSFGGSLKDVPLPTLAATAIKGALAAAKVPADRASQLVLGNVIPTSARDAYLSRVAALDAGMKQESIAYNVNRLCGSGLHAVTLAASAIREGDCEVAVGGGAESMSRGIYASTSTRWGARMGNTELEDYMLTILHDPFHKVHMGITAENVAAQESISREAQDALAAESQRRALRAIRENRFAGQIVPVEIKSKKGTVVFEVDEHPRETTPEALAKMRPAFKKDGGTVTAGNASGINDGAAALVLASEKAVGELNLEPLARIVAVGHAGVDPLFMGLGPVPATKQALAKAGITVEQLDVVESNEAFAAQACAVSKLLGFDPEKTNPNGSGISLGHPVGATGAIIATKVVHELRRTGGRYGLATMCIGAGQGIAVLFERV